MGYCKLLSIVSVVVSESDRVNESESESDRVRVRVLLRVVLC